MIWPLRKATQAKAALARNSSDNAKESMYVSRPRIETAFANALAQGDNLVIYGPSHQGKTMLLTRRLSDADSILIECRPDFKRTQIYRVALSSLGYAVLVEKKRGGKASTTVKLGLGALGAEVNAEGETEQTMQSVTVDLKNPSEVAQLISRIKHLPWLVLNNFQLLDSETKRKLLFDLTFFAERPNMRIIVVGAWSNEDYLEEIEPALAGKFKYLLVPEWSNAELRQAAVQWSARARGLNASMPNLDEFLELAGGDISLFRSLVEGSTAKAESVTNDAAPSSTVSTVQSMILGRFRRGLSTKLQTLFTEREIYVRYLSLQATTSVSNNPAFSPIPNAAEHDYLRTSINTQTNRPYADGRTVLLDRSGNPQFIEQTTGQVISVQTDIASFLLRRFHAVVQKGNKKIELTSLVHQFKNHLDPKPILLDESKLKAVFTRFDEVQREALIVPPMLAVGSSGQVMEIVDRRLFLFLQGLATDDLEDLLENVQPRTIPSARRRNRISPEMTEEEQAAYIAETIPQPPPTPASDEPAEAKQD